MIQNATVKCILPQGKAVVSVRRQSACGHSCEDCASRCFLAGEQVMETVAENSIGAQPGDNVTIVSSTKAVLGIAALVYLLPVALFVAGVVAASALGLSESGSALLAVGLFLVGVLAAAVWGRKRKKNGEISYKIAEIVK